MKKFRIYPFYNSIRFRFGLLFNTILLFFLTGIVILVYNNVRHILEKDFSRRLSTSAYAVLQKTDINPVTVPIPQNGEYFLISYDKKTSIDTLFNALPVKNPSLLFDGVNKTDKWWLFRLSRKLETGGVLTVIYCLSTKEYDAALNRLKTILFIYIPVAVLMSFIIGYFFSGIFLRPLNKMISKANSIDLSNDIKLLEEPVVRDELHELVDAINRMLARIERQAQQQNAFFASASHELRTPLANMLTELQIIEQEKLSPDMEQLVSNQVTEVKRLKELVNNFLWMSQLKAQSVNVHKQKINVAELSLDLIHSFQHKAVDNNVRVKLSFMPVDGSFVLTVDKNQLTIVLSNLLGNALKYGLPDSIIDFTITHSEAAIVIVIKNETNQHINNADDLKREFARSVNYQEGFGLGLWIADQLVQKNGGHLQLQYNEGIFTAELIFDSRKD